MGYGSKDATEKTQQTTEGLLPILQTTHKGKEMKTFKQVLEDLNLHPGHSIKHHYPGKDIPKGYHLMPDGSIMKDSDHPKKDEDELDELSIAQTQQRRRNRNQASLRKSMAKYRAAAKAGIHPSRVHQRRNKLTVKKR